MSNFNFKQWYNLITEGQNDNLQPFQNTSWTGEKGQKITLHGRTTLFQKIIKNSSTAVLS